MLDRASVSFSNLNPIYLHQHVCLPCDRLAYEDVFAKPGFIHHPVVYLTNIYGAYLMSHSVQWVETGTYRPVPWPHVWSPSAETTAGLGCCGI